MLVAPRLLVLMNTGILSTKFTNYADFVSG